MDRPSAPVSASPSPDNLQAVLLGAIGQLRTDMQTMVTQVKTDLSEKIQQLSQRLDKVDDRTMDAAEANRRFDEHENRIRRIEDWRYLVTQQTGEIRTQVSREIAQVERQDADRAAAGTAKHLDSLLSMRQAIAFLLASVLASGVVTLLIYLIERILAHYTYHP